MTEEITKKHRHLPHWQLNGRAYHIVFRSKIGELTPAMRQIVVDTIRFDDGRRFQLFVAVVMPDHTHILLQPLDKGDGNFYSLSEITKPLKGISARKINRLLGTAGVVWLNESFDHLIRNQDDFDKHWEYIFLNPVRAGLVTEPTLFPFLMLPNT